MRKVNRYLAMTLCGGSFVLAVHADKVRFDDLPNDLRDKIRAQTGSAQIEDIDRSTRDGKTLYEVAFKRNGQNTELVFDQSGQLQNSGDPSTLDSRKVTFTELPPVVQRALEARLRGTQPNDIDRRVRNGKITYEVGFKEADQQQEILISQDGRILRDVGTSAAAQAIASTAATRQITQPVPLSNKQKVSPDQLPNPVKMTVGVQSKGARIEDAEYGMWRGRKVYEIAFKDQGQNVELQVEENGRVLHDPRTAWNQAAGVAASAATGRATAAASSAYPAVKSAVTLSSSQKVDLRSIPAQVQQAISKHAPGARVEDVERGTWNGKNVYEVAFKDNGQHVELQLDESGNVVFDPRNK